MKAKEDAKIAELKAMILDLERQEQELMQAIRGEGTPSEIIDRHIKELHRYNEIKDVGQIILGKCAEIEGTTIKEQYGQYGLDLDY
ncbi:swi5-like zinc finger protein [Mortierella sp. GBA30]|nr:swi5-like zinc finger protein [Mortierella sp. GBA30]